MGAPRRKNLIANRRRTDDDGEEEGSVAAGDSSSQGSLVSDLDDDADADAEGSESSDVGAPGKIGMKRRNGDKKAVATNGQAPVPSEAIPEVPLSSTLNDTETMLNGMNILDNHNVAEEIHFDKTDAAAEGEAVVDPPLATSQESASLRSDTLIDKKRREHEEYKKKRDADPAFVPNRGGFFMHDHRSAAPGQNGFRPSGRGRGRGGRGGIGGPFSPLGNPNVPSNPADAPWAHDLHESVAVEGSRKGETSGTNNLHIKPVAPQTAPPPNRSFSRTTHVGNVQLRVFISGMKGPIVFSAVPVNQHTRLPHHRPPLRRDKPVRISFPNCSTRYIFPGIDRSFIFIPRAYRPNHQGFHRGRGRGSFGGYGNFPSGRNSQYGGSQYSPSVAMSRRSSMAREMGRDGMISPAGSVMSRNRSAIVDGGKPVVRLPPTDGPFPQQQYQYPSYPTTPAPVVNLPVPQVYPVPQNPLSYEHLPSSLPMHQPRPQKAVSVAGIESPAHSNFNPPQQQQQRPFFHQVPVVANGQGYPTDPNYYQRSRQASHPSQIGTPLSQIPERAIHAQPFLPFPPQQAPAYYPQQYSTPVYYYPSPVPAMGPPSMAAPPFMPGQQYAYPIPAPPPSAPPEPTTQAGTIAHQSNGMVYYYDQSQLPTTAEEQPPQFQPMAYAPPAGYMVPTPAVYYPSQ